LKVVRESLLLTSEDSEFQTDEAEHRKARFASSHLVNGNCKCRIYGVDDLFMRVIFLLIFKRINNMNTIYICFRSGAPEWPMIYERPISTLRLAEKIFPLKFDLDIYYTICFDHFSPIVSSYIQGGPKK